MWQDESKPLKSSKQSNLPNQMYDPEFPESFNTSKESSPEFDAVRGTEGLNCNSSENDSLMALLAEFGY